MQGKEDQNDATTQSDLDQQLAKLKISPNNNNNVEQNSNNSSLQNSQTSLTSSKNGFNLCPKCDTYYRRSSQHDCVLALKEKVRELEDKVEGLLSQEQVAAILKGYISQEQFLNFVRTTEKKFSELFFTSNSHEEKLKSSSHANSEDQNKVNNIILCSKGHQMIPVGGSRLLTVQCDLCSKKGKSIKGNYVLCCQKCDFDICNECQSRICSKKCPNGHQFEIWDSSESRNLFCDRCKKNVFEKGIFSQRCQKCDFDICNECFLEKSSSMFSFLKE